MPKVGDNLTQKIELRIDKQGETNHRAESHAITSTTIEEFADHPFSEGTPDERSLLRNYDTGDDRIDVIIVGGLHQNSFGEAWTPERQQADPELKPQTRMINSVIIRNQVISNDIVQRVLPHEMGHVLMDVGHVVGETTEMMTGGLPVGTEERVVHGPKRISDPANSAVEIRFDAGFKRKGNPVKFLREHNTTCLTAF